MPRVTPRVLRLRGCRRPRRRLPKSRVLLAGPVPPRPLRRVISSARPRCGRSTASITGPPWDTCRCRPS
eukprot:10603627-Alexandrium_andersonii.AAC.1